MARGGDGVVREEGLVQGACGFTLLTPSHSSGRVSSHWRGIPVRRYVATHQQHLSSQKKGRELSRAKHSNPTLPQSIRRLSAREYVALVVAAPQHSAAQHQEATSSSSTVPLLWLRRLAGDTRAWPIFSPFETRLSLSLFGHRVGQRRLGRSGAIAGLSHGDWPASTLDSVQKVSRRNSQAPSFAALPLLAGREQSICEICLPCLAAFDETATASISLSRETRSKEQQLRD